MTHHSRLALLRRPVVACLAAVAWAGTASAQTAAPAAPITPTGTPAAAEAALADGEIRRVDLANRKLTIRHGPLAALDMPPMTMVFGVREGIALDALQPGGKIRFEAGKVDGKYIVLRIEEAR